MDSMSVSTFVPSVSVTCWLLRSTASEPRTSTKPPSESSISPLARTSWPRSPAASIASVRPVPVTTSSAPPSAV